MSNMRVPPGTKLYARGSHVLTLVDEAVLAIPGEGAVLAPEIAAVAATLVDLMKRNLPPHISEQQQVEAYLALRRIAAPAD